MSRSGRQIDGRVGCMFSHQGEEHDHRNHKTRFSKRAVHPSSNLPSLWASIFRCPRKREVLLASVSSGAMASASNGAATSALLFALWSAIGKFPFAQAVLFQCLSSSCLSAARQNGRPIMTACQRVTMSRQIVTAAATDERICRSKRNGSYPGQTAGMAREPIALSGRLCLLTAPMY